MRHGKLRGIGVASIAAIAAILVGGGGSAPATSTFDSRITIRYDAPGDYLSGWVKSSSEGCYVARWIRVFRKRPGKDELFQKFGTYDDGYWRAQPPTPRGTYYAKVRKDRFGQLICERDRSPNVTVNG